MNDRLRRALLAAGMLLAATAAAALALWPLPTQFSAAVTPDPGDPLLVGYTLAYGAHALANSPMSLFDANVLYPAAGSLAFTESFLGISLPLAPVFWITRSAAASLNTAIVLSLALGGLGAYLLLLRVGTSTGVAAVGGLAFTLMPYRLSEVAHLHVLAIHLLPFALLAAVRLRARPTPLRAVVLGAILALQLWSSLTAGAFTLLALGCWCLVLALRARATGVRALLATVAAGAVALLLASPLLLTYVQVRDGRPESQPSVGEFYAFSATPGSYLASTAHRTGALQGLYTFQHGQAAAQGLHVTERSLFPGLWAIGAAALGLVLLLRRGRGALPEGADARDLALAVALTALAAGVLSLGPQLGAEADGPSLPTAPLYRAVPLMRVPARFGVLVQVGFVLLGALALDRLAPRLRSVALALSVPVLLLDAWSGPVPLVGVPVVQQAHTRLADGEDAVVALPAMEIGADGAPVGVTVVRDAVHMYLSTANFRPLVNGYSQFVPQEYVEIATLLQDFPSARSLEGLRELRVGTVVVETALLGGTPWEDVERRLEAVPGVRRVATGPGVSVYELPSEPVAVSAR